jgi:hypothetical protein
MKSDMGDFARVEPVTLAHQPGVADDVMRVIFRPIISQVFSPKVYHQFSPKCCQ